MNIASVIATIILVVGGLLLTILLSVAIFQEKSQNSPASKEQDQAT